MTRPHDRRRARLEPRKQTLVLPNRDLRAAVLALLRGYDLPAGQPGDELHPVANAEEWNAEIQNAGIGGRGPFIEYRSEEPTSQRQTPSKTASRLFLSKKKKSMTRANSSF